MKQNQCNRIIEYINDFGSINPIQALSDLGVMRLASRINDLKRMGFPIRKRMVSSKNRYGENVSYAEYYLEEKNEQ